MTTKELRHVSVFYKDILCGSLVKNEENYTFKYNQSYIDQGHPAIAYNFPLQVIGFDSDDGSLHPFFDNLASEGWLRQHQADALKADRNDRFQILTHFGFDMAGAVYFDAPELNQDYPMTIESSQVDSDTLKRVVSIESRASISGIQKKVLVRKQMSGEFVITKKKELGTHIAKLYTDEYPEIVELEFVSTLAVKHLLPEDCVCEIEIGYLSEINEKALFVKRFDRAHNEHDERIHFEEINSLLGKVSDDKYDASYDDIGRFIRDCPMCRDPNLACLTVYKRILVCILIGNTDAHLKNFAMFYMDDSLVLTPMYDIVCSSFYSQFNQLALKINNQQYDIFNLKPKHLVNLGRDGFGLSDDEIRSIVKSLESNLNSTFDVLESFEDKYIPKEASIKKSLISIIKKRWNGSFKGIPKFLDLRKK